MQLSVSYFCVHPIELIDSPSWTLMVAYFGISWIWMNLVCHGLSIWGEWMYMYVVSALEKSYHTRIWKGFGGRERKLESDEIIFLIFKKWKKKLMLYVKDFRYKESKARETAHRTKRIPNWQWGLKARRAVSFSNSDYHRPVQWKWKTFQIQQKPNKSG